MKLHGQQIIGYQTSAEGGETFHAWNTESGKEMETAFHQATEEEVDRAVNLAASVFNEYRNRPAEDRAKFLDTIADEIEALGDDLLELANAETALGIPRLTGERARTCNGARMFANMIREGSWVDARIETANPDRKPAPKPDLRLMYRPVGPAVVFGASNFPLAISVAGTDTVSALGAGCPVVVKAHPAHPGTCELVATAIVAAAKKCEMPDGVFSLIQGPSNEVGINLVEHEKTEVVAFTGSLRGGRALYDVACGRRRPIPFYGEMGSLNPVFLLPGALKKETETLAQGFVGSLTLGVGQFCTNPGLVLGFKGEELENFVSTTAEKAAEVPPATMLHEGIHSAYIAGTERLRSLSGVKEVAKAPDPHLLQHQAAAAVFQTSIDNFFANETTLKEEVFGPSSVVLECQSPEDMVKFAEAMDCSLSATVHGTEEDLEEYRDLITVLETRTGRLVFNGYPTGLDVCTAMHHGGPYPATTHGFFTSVGTNAILRFVRPIAYQDFPEKALPAELHNQNGKGIWRMVNGETTKEDV